MWILVAMIALMPFEMNPHLLISESFLGIFPQFTVIKLVGLIGLWWVIFELGNGRSHPDFGASRQAKAFAAFLVTAILAGLAIGGGLKPVTSFLAMCLLFPIVLTVVRSERSLRATLKACVFVMVLVYPYVLRQSYRFGGPLGDGLNDVNYFALQLVVVLPLAFAYGSQEPVRQRRVLWYLAGLLLIVQTIQTGSRGGFIALLAVVVLTGLRLTRRPLLGLTGIAAVLVFLVLVVPTPLVYRLLASGLDSTVESTAVTMSNEARMLALEAGTRTILENPLTGVGLGNFRLYKILYGERFVSGPNTAHNTYVEIAAEMGVGALIMFLLMIGIALRSLRESEKLAREHGNIRLAKLAIGLQTSLVGYLVGAMFLSAQYEKFLWLMVFLSVCMERIIRQQVRSASGASARKEPAWVAR